MIHKKFSQFFQEYGSESSSTELLAKYFWQGDSYNIEDVLSYGNDRIDAVICDNADDINWTGSVINYARGQSKEKLRSCIAGALLAESREPELTSFDNLVIKDLDKAH
ncbi:MAG: hypothetical protein FWE16_04115 [Firmicutes bacterium]|nr:hypothetical protein [Bacillota bacterium]